MGSRVFSDLSTSQSCLLARSALHLSRGHVSRGSCLWRTSQSVGCPESVPTHLQGLSQLYSVLDFQSHGREPPSLETCHIWLKSSRMEAHILIASLIALHPSQPHSFMHQQRCSKMGQTPPPVSTAGRVFWLWVCWSSPPGTPPQTPPG